MGKQIQICFRNLFFKRKTSTLHFVLSDFCSMSDKTFEGCSYFVTFIDDHFRKVWAYGLKIKDQMLDIFQQFHVSIERKTRRKLKCIRIDNGGEYKDPFEKYCQ